MLTVNIFEIKGVFLWSKVGPNNQTYFVTSCRRLNWHVITCANVLLWQIVRRKIFSLTFWSIFLGHKYLFQWKSETDTLGECGKSAEFGFIKEFMTLQLTWHFINIDTFTAFWPTQVQVSQQKLGSFEFFQSS